MNTLQYAIVVLSAVLPSIIYYGKYPLSTMFFMALFAVAVTYIAMYYIEPLFYIGGERCSIDE
jgi:hypothetical protein